MDAVAAVEPVASDTLPAAALELSPVDVAVDLTSEDDCGAGEPYCEDAEVYAGG